MDIVRLAPVAGVAYVLPLLFAPGHDSAAVVTVAEVIARRLGAPSADDLGDLPGADARGAHMDTAWRPVDQSPDALDVGIPPPLRPPV